MTPTDQKLYLTLPSVEDFAHKAIIKDKDGNLWTTSLMVAEAFEKRPDNVNMAIRRLKCSASFRLLNFKESSYTNQQGKDQPMFHISEKGLMRLVMGFTGEKAAEAQEKWVEAFDFMRKELAQRAAPVLGEAGIVSALETLSHRLAMVESERDYGRAQLMEQPAPLGVLPTLSRADDIHGLVRAYCMATGTAKGKFLELVYKDLLDYFNVDLSRRKARAGVKKSTLLFAIEIGYGDHLYALAHQRAMTQVFGPRREFGNAA